MWAVYAVGSAVFAALTSILAKIGIENVNSNLATAIRTVVVLLLAWGMVSFTPGGALDLPRAGLRFSALRPRLFIAPLRCAPNGGNGRCGELAGQERAGKGRRPAARRA